MIHVCVGTACHVKGAGLVKEAIEKELGLDREKTNVNGSGISLGHPVGSTGARLIVTLHYELERQGLNLGVAGLCAGGGVGTAVMLERC
jgi:acetyl-CoA C-acetyltransferase